MDALIKSLLMALPQVNSLLERPELREWMSRYRPDLVKLICRRVLERRRQEILSGQTQESNVNDLVPEIGRELDGFMQPRVRRVLNGTGILLHTGLGRSPISPEDCRAALERVGSACDIELDLNGGERGDRQEKLDELICFLTNAQSSAIVNNNAAAVLLALNTLAFRKEVIVARGQLIEIGGSFRLPEVMRKSGARLVEVGTTNKTYLRDYEEAISPKTGAILLAHTSNYRIKGFVHEVAVDELSGLCHQRELPLIHDLGGGVLLDLGQWGLPHEPVVSQSVLAGCSVVTFSGDKILGGPQAGIMVGERSVIQRLRKNPLMRALRPDKFTLALLEQTLKSYLSPTDLRARHFVLERLTESAQTASRRAQGVLQSLTQLGWPPGIHIEVVATTAQLGSGALPLEEFTSSALKIRAPGISSAQLSQRLRRADPPIIGYLRKDWLFVDLKAIADPDLPLLAQALSRILAGLGNNKS
jgi:L-seryl-tRNA(Ser) seleniumtransferase